MKIKEKRKKQHLIQMIGMLPFLLVYILPGFDRRFGWSDVPFPIALIGLALVLIGYLMILYVFITNSYASRVIEVEKEQRVITTGPYALVRHPMYVGVVFFYGITPIALGSYWAMIPSLLIIPILVFRIIDEEKELLENLAGYREYTQKVRYRLVPGLW
jgi:protein-S-isoprenylcysteine O-methyltransferase Ste14